VNKKHNKQRSNSRSTSPNHSSNRINEKSPESNGLKTGPNGITADIVRRVSRYQKHCQQLEKSDYIEPKKHSESPESEKKSSFSSSRENTPSVANQTLFEARQGDKLSKSIDTKEQSLDAKASNSAPQKSPIEIYKENIANKVSLYSCYSLL